MKKASLLLAAAAMLTLSVPAMAASAPGHDSSSQVSKVRVVGGMEISDQRRYRRHRVRVCRWDWHRGRRVQVCRWAWR
ncbi:MAG: hypothetical protein AB7K04_05655 [Pseudorhodoplanes sp.]